MFKYYLYKFGQFCVNHLPLQLAYRFSIWISDLHYFFSFRDRHAVRENLRVILPSTENLTKVTRQTFRNFGLYLVEFFRMAKQLDAEFIKKKVKIKNLDRIEKALSRGKGCIFISGHVGNWEVGGALISILGYKMVVVALPHKERPVNDLFNQQRQSKGLEVIPPNISVRKCLETLKNNGMVALIADRDFSQSGEIMSFLGKPTYIPKGPAIFAAKTGAAIVPVFFMREKGDEFVLTVEEPIIPKEMAKGEIVEENVLIDLMNQYIPSIEKKIRQYPDQWLMFRPFWADPKNVPSHIDVTSAKIRQPSFKES